jgi:hypothetical protein
MKNLNQMLANPQQTIQKASEYQGQRVEINDNARRVVDKAFNSLKACFPAWKHALPDEESVNNYKAQLVKAIMEAGITTQAEIARGVSRARTEDKPFMPSTGEFVKWCRPTLEDYGLPPSKIAAREFMANRHRMYAGDEVQWSHPAVCVAGRSMRSFDVDHMTSIQYEESYEYAYDVVCRRVFSGEDLTSEIPKAIPKDIPVPRTPEEQAKYEQVAKDTLAGLRKMLGGF